MRILASGYLGTERAPLFRASGPTTVRSLRLVNDDTGTGSYEANLWLRRKNEEPLPLWPHNVWVGVEDAVEDRDEWPLEAGDQIEGYASVAGVLAYFVKGE